MERSRTQTELQTYQTSPVPVTSPGLLAEYNFNNLVNQQGNTTYNATIVNSCAINQTNIVCDFTLDACFPPTTNTCNNWLKLGNYPSTVSIGDLDVTGNNLTVEAAFVKTADGSSRTSMGGSCFETYHCE